MKPTVSICCTTFNHVDYIGKCIDGFLMQQTDFPIEILIFEDASTDGTAEIVRKYAAQDNRIITFIQTENQWSQNKYGMINWLFPAAKGKYIAICEGDDYWTDPLKLQKQVDVLEADPSVAMVYSDAATLKDGVLGEFYNPGRRPKGVFDFEKFLYQNQKWGVPTATAMLRSEAVQEARQFFQNKGDDSIQGDYVLWFCAGTLGKFHFMEEKTAVYRQHGTGLMGTLGGSRKWLEKGMELNHLLAKHISPEHTAFLHAGDWWYYMELSFLDLQEKKWLSSLKHITRSLQAAGKSGKNNRIQIVRDYFYRFRT
jgi:glycosyltransferase involved in cell wall biosynthesis